MEWIFTIETDLKGQIATIVLMPSDLFYDRYYKIFSRPNQTVLPFTLDYNPEKKEFKIIEQNIFIAPEANGPLQQHVLLSIGDIICCDAASDHARLN